MTAVTMKCQCFLYIVLYLAKMFVMKNEDILQRFEMLLETLPNSAMDHENICALVGVTPAVMDEILMDCVGYECEKIVKSYKSAVPILLL